MLTQSVKKLLIFPSETEPSMLVIVRKVEEFWERIGKILLIV